jgi:hypothetical protein
MIKEAMKPENSSNWLGSPKKRPYSREVVESKYNPMLKVFKDRITGEPSSQYPPFIRLVLPTRLSETKEFAFGSFDENGNLMKISPDPQSPDYISKKIPPKSWCSALISGSIWCSIMTGYGVTWRVVQIKVFSSKGNEDTSTRTISPSSVLTEIPYGTEELVDEEIIENVSITI